MQELIELALKKIDDLERKLEKYYSMLFVGNEIDFILKGTYVLEKDVENALTGAFEEGNDD